MKRSTSIYMAISVAVGLSVGAAVGLGGYTFLFAKGYSYLLNDPQACANCHVMQGHLDAWSRSSHRSVAVCNDCHLPEGMLAKYVTKAVNGYNHGYAFTMGGYPDPLRIRPINKGIAEAACRTCHGDITHQIERVASAGKLDCTRCHADVGHAR